MSKSRLLSFWNSLLQNPNKCATCYFGSFTITLLLAFSGLGILYSSSADQNSISALINLSGRQRMLSQQINLLLYGLASESSLSEKSPIQAQLEDSLKLFEESHAKIIGQKNQNRIFSEAQRDHYFKAPEGLDLLTAQYIERARSLASQLSQSPQETAIPDLKAFSEFTRGPYLSRLHAAVSGFQTRGEEINHETFLVEVFIFSSIILIFMVQTFFIFMPMIRTLNEALQAARFNMVKLTETEKMLRESQATFKGIFDHSPVGICLADIDFKLSKVSPSFCHMLGYDGDALIGKDFADISHVEDRSIDKIPAQILMDGKAETVAFEKRLLHKGGDPISVQVSAGVLRDTQGKPIHLLAIVSDITGKKRVNEELRAAKEQAEADKIFSESITRLIPDTIYLLDLQDQKIVYVNRNLLNDLGHDTEKGRGGAGSGFGDKDLPLQKFMEVFMHPEDRERVRSQQSQFSEMKDGEFVESVFRLQSGSGDWRWFMSRRTVFRRSSEGRPLQIIGITTDITQQRRAMELSRIAEEEALKAARVKTEFLANMSHEIRTPLTGVIGMTDLLLATPLSEIQDKYTRIIRESGAGLLTVINDILDFSKIEAGKMAVEIQEFDLKEMIRGQVDLLRPRALEKNLAIGFHLDPDLSKVVKGDPIRIGQVLLNLIGNAIKFTERGDIVIRSEKTEDEFQRPMISFSVSDTGIGIPPDVQKTLFNPFTQADGSTARKYGGTGLGLSISKQIVEMMSGQIGLSSEKGQGSTFWFTIPYEPVQEGRVLARSKVNPASSEPVVSFSGRKILLADDNPINQLLISTLIRHLGCFVQVVTNGKEALNAMAKDSFDLVLMDCQMPEMDGFETTEKIRSAEKASGQRVPIVALTANALKDDIDRCLQHGMDQHLSKPIVKEQLYAVLARFLVS